MNYEQEVKKVYHNARSVVQQRGYDTHIVILFGNNKKISDEFKNEQAAWQSAYEKLKQQNRL